MNKHKDRLNIKKICAIIMAAYFVCAICFYYIAGTQLYERESVKNIDELPSELITAELVTGNSVSQTFKAGMDVIQNLSIRFATFARENQGQINIKLYDNDTGTVYTDRIVEMAQLPDSQLYAIPLSQEPSEIEGHSFTLEITCINGQVGSSVGVWYGNTEAQKKYVDWEFAVNNQNINGTLSFAAIGKDLVWTGPHYLQLTIAGAVVVGILLLYVIWNYNRGKRNFIINMIWAFKKYRFLMAQLIGRDFKTKYKRSVLGVLWSFLNPFLSMIVQYVVFSTIFKADIDNYPVYLLTGIIFFNFFSEATNMSLTSIVGNATLITKVYMPKYIYPVSRVLSSLVNFGFSLIPLLIMIIFTHEEITKAYTLLIFPVLCLMIFCIGMAFLLSAAMVFFRDMQFLWGVFCMMWMYSTPIFYPENILPPQFAIVHSINPLYHILKFSRFVIMQGVSPEPRLYVLCLMPVLLVLVIGTLVFKRTQDKFIFYI
ncbi:MAG: ABC transporter permease [Aminipila sp.]